MLEVRELSKRFGSRPALQGLSLQVNPGEIVGLVGPNGAGKTTALNCIAGLLPPDGGEIRWQGRRLEPGAGMVALLPEQPELYPFLTVAEHLEFMARLHRLQTGWKARAQDLSRRLALEGLDDRLGDNLSKGQRQRVLLATVLLREPPVLLIDEPFIGLDPAGQRELRRLLRELADGGTGMVLSSHQLGLVEELAGTIVVLSRGRPVATGDLEHLRTLAGGAGASLEDVFLQLTSGEGEGA